MINSEIDLILKKQREYFDAGNTLDIQKRIGWLKLLKSQFIKYEKQLAEAIKKDLNRQEDVSFIFEFKLIYNDLNKFIKHLHKWAKDTKVKPMFLLYNKKARIVHTPHGQVYLIVPFNFPILLGIQPLIGSIGCGNTTFYKPSKLTPNVNLVIKELLSVFPKELVYFLDQSLSNYELENLNAYKWDFIFFTGSNNTAKKIYEHQYMNFIPSVFELGGKSPMVIDDTADLKLAAVKFLTTKLINAGQICLGVDYLILKKNIIKPFLQQLINTYNELKNDKYFVGSLITKQKVDEVNYWLNNEDNSSFVIKDFHDLKGYEELKFALIPYDKVKNKEYLDNELFSPISYYKEFETPQDVIDIVKEHNFPLTFYCFSKNAEFINYLKYRIQSGSFVVNETLSQAMHSYLPFGGIRNSGMGKYHAKFSFETFSLNKPFLTSKWYGDAKIFDIRNVFDNNKIISKIAKKK